MTFDLRHNELSWQRESEELERTRNKREQEELAEEKWDYAPRYALAHCDGSGIVEEFQVDVDLFDVIPCRGCCACDPENFPEFEMVRVHRTTPRKPVSREVADGAWSPSKKDGVA